jgi:hypothetical protein
MITVDQQAETTMIALKIPVEGVVLDVLDAFLSSDQSPDEAEMQAVLGGILRRYSQIRQEITNGTFEPILWSNAAGTAIGRAEGLIKAWAYAQQNGSGYLDPKTAPVSSSLILALCDDQNGESLCGLESEDEYRIAAEGATLLPCCAMVIDAYWRLRQVTNDATSKASNRVRSCSPLRLQ